jgi:hypothetical protein
MPKQKKAAVKVIKKAIKKTVKVVKKAAKKPKQDSPQKPSRATAPKITKKPAAANPVIPIKLEPSLGRPLVTQEEKLYMLFLNFCESTR